VVTWNTTALFGLASGRGKQRCQQRFHILQGLASKSDIVMLQEIHGTRADLEVALSQLPDFVAFSSHINPATGGVAILCRRTLISDPDAVFEIIFDPGRCIMVFLPDIQTSFICLHITPAYTIDQKRKLLLFIRDASHMQCTDTILCGEFNFSTSTDAKFCFEMLREDSSDDPLAIFFDEHFCCLTELHQAQHTRKQILRGRISSSRRLDRIYTSIPPIHINDMRPYTAVTHILTDPTFQVTTFRCVRCCTLPFHAHRDRHESHLGLLLTRGSAT
jgi:endonuclease/exonuclease/phosphatase family metal-dependent hydrolase